ncbi:MAG: hypothetical protein V7750_16355 [Sneathiella sp.]
MSSSYREAYSDLLVAQKLLNSQDLSVLDPPRQLEVVQMQGVVFAEIQALLVQRLSARNEEYSAATEGLQQSEAEFLKIKEWAESAENGEKIFGGILKGISILLPLL